MRDLVFESAWGWTLTSTFCSCEALEDKWKWMQKYKKDLQAKNKDTYFLKGTHFIWKRPIKGGDFFLLIEVEAEIARIYSY